MSDDLDTGRKTPPEEHEWPTVWQSLERSNKSWIITGPIHAAISNWRAWLVIAAVIAYIRGEQIITLIADIVGAAK